MTDQPKPPEAIYIDPSKIGQPGGCRFFVTKWWDANTAYVPKDLHDAEVERLKQDVRELEAACTQHLTQAMENGAAANRYRDEVQRLTDDRDSWAKQAEIQAQSLRESNAEVERLNLHISLAHSSLKNFSDEAERLRKALERIAKWFGEFPPTGCQWEDGSPMSYAAAFGSNGERDYIRGVAHEALHGAGSKSEDPKACSS